MGKRPLFSARPPASKLKTLLLFVGNSLANSGVDLLNVQIDVVIQCLARLRFIFVLATWWHSLVGGARLVGAPARIRTR